MKDTARSIYIAGRALFFFGALGVLPVVAEAAELLMFTRKGCPYCALFERQVGPIYPKTPEAAIAPLKRIDVDTQHVSVSGVSPEAPITPTFVLIDSGREIGRFSGYSDDLTFWSMLAVQLKRLDNSGPSPKASTP